MEYQQALIIGRRRRSDAALALSMYMQERAFEMALVQDDHVIEQLFAECRA